MRIPPYWTRGTFTATDARGRERTCTACGWSFESAADAKADAEARALRICERLAEGDRPEDYDYLEHPLREEIVASIGETGGEEAVLTRNRYGALVLNTARVCFADVDFPLPRPANLLDALCLRFSPSRRRAQAGALQEETIRAVRDWAGRNPERSLRIYRTAAGLRLLFTDRLYDPASDEVAALLAELGSDALYRRLTLKQECFRARLTPKPWRCGCTRPPHRYPWASEAEEKQYRAWQHSYENRAGDFGVCTLVATLGADAAEEQIQSVVALHDKYVLGAPGAALA